MSPLRSKTIKSILAAPMLIIPVVSILNFSLTTVRFWEVDSIPGEYVQRVIKECENKKISTIRIEGMGAVSWNYQMLHANKKTPIARFDSPINSYYDFVIAFPKNMGDFTDKYSQISQKGRLGPVLYKRKNDLKKIKLGSFSSDSSYVTFGEYQNLAQFNLSSLKSQTLLYSIEIKLEFPYFPSQQYLYVNASTSTASNLISSASICIDDIFFEEQQGTVNLQLSGFLENLPMDQPIEILMFVHDSSLRTLKIHSTSAELYSVLNGTLQK